MIEIHGGGFNLKVDLNNNDLNNDLEWLNFINLKLLPPPLVLTDRILIKPLNENSEEVLTNLTRLNIGMILNGVNNKHYILMNRTIIPIEGNLIINQMLNSSISTVIDLNIARDSRLGNMSVDQKLKLKSIILNSIDIKKSNDKSLDINHLYNELIALLI